MSLPTMPVPADFGIPKTQMNPVVDANKQVLYTEYNDLGTILCDVADSVGVDDGTTPNSLRQALAYTWTTVVWRPTEPSPEQNVYDNAGTLLTAIASARGPVRIVLDNALSGVFSIPAGAYPLLCNQLEFIGTDTAITCVIPNGVTFTGGTIRQFSVNNCTVEWRGTTTSLIPTTTTMFRLALRGTGVLAASSSSVVMFALGETSGITCEGMMNGITTSAYELISIPTTKSIYAFLGFQTTIGANTFRGAGTVIGFFNSIAGSTLNTQANLTSLASSDTAQALLARITTLEAPTSVDENSAAVSWTTQKRIRHTHTAALATYTFNANTTQWPVGESRLIAQYSASTLGFQFAVPTGHALNGVTNGVSGVLATAAMAAGSQLTSFLVTREGASAWSWA